MKETLFIGMPVFNGERFIGEAIKSIMGQTYHDWKLLISDNNSSDTTGEICKSFAIQDERISYAKQVTNLGVAGNFLFLLNVAETEFFMWAAADDQWDPQFIEKCITPLILNKNISFSFCNIKNIDSFGNVIRDLPSFSLFANEDKAAQIAAFMLDPEFMGKANLIYGIYSLDNCKQAMQTSLKRGMDVWGSDIAFIFTILLLPCNLYIEEACLFFKRIASSSDINTKPKLIEAEFPNLNGIPLAETDYLPYFNLLIEVCAGTRYTALVKSLIGFRIKLSQDITGYENKWKPTQSFLRLPWRMKKLGIKLLSNRN